MTFPDDHKSQMPVHCPLDTTIVIDQRDKSGFGLTVDRRKCPQFHNEAVCPLYIGTRIGGQCSFRAMASSLAQQQETIWNWRMITRLIRGLADAAIGIVKVARGPYSGETGTRFAPSVLKSHDGIALYHDQSLRSCARCGFLTILAKDEGEAQCRCGAMLEEAAK